MSGNEEQGVKKNGIQRIALGTAQFGLDYGVTNLEGQVSFTEAQRIIDVGLGNGLGLVDTAASYGDSEEVLGKLKLGGTQVVTKLPSFHSSIGSGTVFVGLALENSLHRLQELRIFGLLVHDPKDLETPYLKQLSRGLDLAKKSGLVEKVGVSVYHPQQLRRVLETFRPDIVQLPFSLVDRRFLEHGWLTKLSKLGIEVHARSIFLQGALLEEPNNTPTPILPWRQTLEDFHNWCSDSGVNKLSACLGFALAQEEISKVIVGATSAKQFSQVLLESQDPPSEFPEISSEDLRFIDPTQWVV